MVKYRRYKIRRYLTAVSVKRFWFCNTTKLNRNLYIVREGFGPQENQHNKDSKIVAGSKSEKS